MNIETVALFIFAATISVLFGYFIARSRGAAETAHLQQQLTGAATERADQQANGLIPRQQKLDQLQETLLEREQAVAYMAGRYPAASLLA